MILPGTVAWPQILKEMLFLDPYQKSSIKIPDSAAV